MMPTRWLAGFAAGIVTGAAVAIVLPALAQIQLATVLGSGSAGLTAGSLLTVGCSDGAGVVSPGKEMRVTPLFTAPASPSVYALYQLSC